MKIKNELLKKFLIVIASIIAILIFMYITYWIFGLWFTYFGIKLVLLIPKI